MTRSLASTLVVLVACTSDPGRAPGTDTSAFDADCAGSAASCGQLAVRWSITRAMKPAACAEVDGAHVEVTATFQADRRAATFTPACDAGAMLTPRLPLGPYALEATLVDATGAVLGTRTANATLGLAGVVTETDITFDVAPVVKPGELFGACSTASPCHDPSLQCITIAGGDGTGFCTRPCVGTDTNMACRNAVHDAGGDIQGEVVDRLDGSKGTGEVFGVNDRLRHRNPS